MLSLCTNVQCNKNIVFFFRLIEELLIHTKIWIDLHKVDVSLKILISMVTKCIIFVNYKLKIHIVFMFVILDT